MPLDPPLDDVPLELVDELDLVTVDLVTVDLIFPVLVIFPTFP